MTLASCFKYLRYPLCLCSDFVLWFVLGLGLLGSILAMDFKALPFVPQPTQNIRLNVEDAYSLSEGSPVLFMGVPVGYVKAVHLNADKNSIEIDYTLENPSLKIPSDAEALIVAAGLGGAKSLEFSQSFLHSDAMNNTSPHQQKVIQPFRQKLMWSYQIKVANTLRQGANSLGNALNTIPVGPHRDDLFLRLKQIEALNREAQALQTRLPTLQAHFSTKTKDLTRILTQSNTALSKIMKDQVLLHDLKSPKRQALIKQIEGLQTLMQEERQLLHEVQMKLDQKVDPLSRGIPLPHAPS
jgi:ABC-type transporter Mla subunit MlaD